MPDYRTYFIRDGIEYEVSAVLVEPGKAYLDEDETGADLIVEQDPNFDEIFCEDPETGCELEMTEGEFLIIVTQLVGDYWKYYN